MLLILNYLYINHYVHIGKHICIIFLSLFLIKNFRGTCSSAKMLKRYKARESFGNHCNPSRTAFHMLFPPNFYLPWKYLHTLRCTVESHYKILPSQFLLQSLSIYKI